MRSLDGSGAPAEGFATGGLGRRMPFHSIHAAQISAHQNRTFNMARPKNEACGIGRGERIRTSDSCVPNAVLYQAELHPAR